MAQPAPPPIDAAYLPPKRNSAVTTLLWILLAITAFLLIASVVFGLQERAARISNERKRSLEIEQLRSEVATLQRDLSDAKKIGRVRENEIAEVRKISQNKRDATESLIAKYKARILLLIDANEEANKVRTLEARMARIPLHEKAETRRLLNELADGSITQRSFARLEAIIGYDPMLHRASQADSDLRKHLVAKILEMLERGDSQPELEAFDREQRELREEMRQAIGE